MRGKVKQKRIAARRKKIKNKIKCHKVMKGMGS